MGCAMLLRLQLLLRLLLLLLLLWCLCTTCICSDGCMQRRHSTVITARLTAAFGHHCAQRRGVIKAVVSKRRGRACMSTSTVASATADASAA